MLIEFIHPDFKFSDERGTLIQLVSTGWRQVNYITSTSNSLRGNHYHVHNKEAFYILSGSFKLSLVHLETRETSEYFISAGDFFIIYPKVIHSFEYTSYTELISLYDKGVVLSDGSKDIISVL